MIPVASVLISLARPADDRLRAAVQVEGSAVLASVAPAATLDVVVAADAAADAMAIDEVPCELYRELRPFPTDPNRRGRGLAWQLFWQLVKRVAPGASKPDLTGIGGCRREQVEDALRELGLELGTWRDEGAIAGLEPGPRLRVGALLSPVLDAVVDGSRGDPCLGGVLRRLATRFVTPADVELLLQRIGTERPYLARALAQRYSLPVLTEVLRALVDEGVTIKPRRLIGETLLAINCTVSAELDAFIVFAPPVLGVAWCQAPVERLAVPDLAQCVREAMKEHNTAVRSVSSLDFRESWGMTLYRPEWTIEVGLLDPAIEKAVASGRFADTDAALLAAELEKELLTLARPGPRSQVPLLTISSCRHMLWRQLREFLPGQEVLSYHELAPEANVKPLFRLSL